VDVELLPAQRDVRIVRERGKLTEATLRAHDAAIVVCEREHAAKLLSELPFTAVWQRLQRQARERGAGNLLTARLTPALIPITVALLPRAASTFECLALAGRAWKEIAGALPARVLLATRGFDAARAGQALEALVAAALAGTAPMPTLRSKPPRAPAIRRITLIGDGAAVDASRSIAVDRGNHLARWLTMLPPNVLDSASYRDALRDLARQRAWKFTALDEPALRKAGAGAFLAVARANAGRGAGIVRLQHRSAAAPEHSPRLALVGKGICFDTGGINLKAHKSMYQMHEDMQGSAVAVGTLLALSTLEVPFEIDCWLAITENQIGPQAYRPQEVVRAANGVTIQVAHSDAEGRMVLADTLALAAREQPDLILDFATLTGACVGALTERYSGAFTNRADWHARIEHAGRESGERVWPFPMDEDYDADLESQVADVLQCTPDSKGDHILAARFLSRFVPKQIPWIHIDLAASNRSGGLAHIPTDFTGFGVRFATHLLLEHGVLEQQPTGSGLRARVRKA
jgi:leucyl aminopeptidase